MIELHNNSTQICVNASTTTGKKNETAKKKVRALGGWLGGPTCRIMCCGKKCGNIIYSEQ